MARRKKKEEKREEETLIDVVGGVEQAQDFVERNQSTILMVIGGIVLVVGGVLAYMYLYKAPRETSAQEEMYQAQLQFEKDSFALALDNPGGGAKGFLGIIDNYSGTRAANVSNYYAGLCYLHLGNYKVAADYLEDYSPKDRTTASYKMAALGDAYSELNEKDKALGYYKKATTTQPNEFSTPLHLMKLGQYLESTGDAAGAKDAYDRIMKEYPNSLQAAEAEKYLIRSGGE